MNWSSLSASLRTFLLHIIPLIADWSVIAASSWVMACGTTHQYTTGFIGIVIIYASTQMCTSLLMLTICVNTIQKNVLLMKRRRCTILAAAEYSFTAYKIRYYRRCLDLLRCCYLLVSERDHGENRGSHINAHRSMQVTRAIRNIVTPTPYELSCTKFLSQVFSFHIISTLTSCVLKIQCCNAAERETKSLDLLTTPALLLLSSRRLCRFNDNITRAFSRACRPLSLF